MVFFILCEYIYIHVCVCGCVCMCICVRQTSILTIGMEFIFYCCFLVGKPSTTKGKFYSMKVFCKLVFQFCQAQEIGTTLNDNVIKPSAEQASKLGTAIQQNVVEPTRSKVQEGTLWKDVSKGATSFASTVSTYIFGTKLSKWS